jgi:dipeptide/tripeptide permease
MIFCEFLVLFPPTAQCSPSAGLVESLRCLIGFVSKASARGLTKEQIGFMLGTLAGLLGLLAGLYRFFFGKAHNTNYPYDPNLRDLSINYRQTVRRASLGSAVVYTALALVLGFMTICLRRTYIAGILGYPFLLLQFVIAAHGTLTSLSAAFKENDGRRRAVLVVLAAGNPLICVATLWLLGLF